MIKSNSAYSFANLNHLGILTRIEDLIQEMPRSSLGNIAMCDLCKIFDPQKIFGNLVVIFTKYNSKVQMKVEVLLMSILYDKSVNLGLQ